MDEQLKARLIGATILVVLAVLLVPEMLSGRKQDTTDAASGSRKRTVTIDLGGAVSKSVPVAPEATPSPRTPPSDSDSTSTPAPAMPSSDASDVPPDAAVVDATPKSASPAPRPAPPTPQSVSPPAETTPAPPAGNTRTAAVASGGWSVQVGAFGSSESARKLVSDLKRDGFTAYVSPLARGGKTLHRVRVGPETSRDAADRLAVRLKGRGLPAAVVAND
jgi:DedD protein